VASDILYPGFPWSIDTKQVYHPLLLSSFYLGREKITQDTPEMV
jgi:hypothetical protein